MNSKQYDDYIDDYIETDSDSDCSQQFQIDSDSYSDIDSDSCSECFDENVDGHIYITKLSPNTYAIGWGTVIDPKLLFKFTCNPIMYYMATNPQVQHGKLCKCLERNGFQKINDDYFPSKWVINNEKDYTKVLQFIRCYSVPNNLRN